MRFVELRYDRVTIDVFQTYLDAICHDLIFHLDTMKYFLIRLSNLGQLYTCRPGPMCSVAKGHDTGGDSFNIQDERWSRFKR